MVLPAVFFPQWKGLQWVVQFLVPELIDVCRTLPVPLSSHPQAPAPSPAPGGPSPSPNFALPPQQPVASNAVGAVNELRLQLGRVVAATAESLGPQFTRQVLLPLFSAAACAMDASFAAAPPSGPSGQAPDQALPLDLALALSYLGNDMGAPGHIQDAAAQLLPNGAEAVRLAR